MDNKVHVLLSEATVAKHRKQTMDELADIRKKQATLRQELNVLIQEGQLDKGTREYLSSQLKILAKHEEDAKEQLADEQVAQRKYDQLQQRIVEFHEQCEEWREKLDDPQFTPSYQFWRNACEFFGICAILWRIGTEPRFEIRVNPPDIVELLS